MTALVESAKVSPVPLSIRSLADAFAWLEKRERDRLATEALGEYLDKTFLFVHFVTLTLRDRAVKGLGRVPLGTLALSRAWSWFEKELEKVNGGVRPAGFRVTEYQKRGVPHVHALTVNTAAALGSERALERSCWTEFGRSTVWRFRPGYGAAGYLAKYVAKDSRVEVFAFGRLSRYCAPLVSVGENGPGAAAARMNSER